MVNVNMKLQKRWGVTTTIALKQAACSLPLAHRDHPLLPLPPSHHPLPPLPPPRPSSSCHCFGGSASLCSLLPASCPCVRSSFSWASSRICRWAGQGGWLSRRQWSTHCCLPTQEHTYLPISLLCSGQYSCFQGSQARTCWLMIQSNAGESGALHACRPQRSFT